MKLNNRFWKKYFKVYDFLNLAIPYKELYEFLIKSSSLIKGKKILDAGSGTGNLSVILINLGADVFSLDTSMEGLNVQRNKQKRSKLILHDLINHTPFDDDYFDIIFSINTICYIDIVYRQAIFNEFYRILKPGGQIMTVNLLKGFNPIKMLWYHLSKYYKIFGFRKVILHFLKLIFVILLMMFYTIKISISLGRRDNFFNEREQESYLINAGFRSISNSVRVFAEQAIFTKGYK